MTFSDHEVRSCASRRRQRCTQTAIRHAQQHAVVLLSLLHGPKIDAATCFRLRPQRPKLDLGSISLVKDDRLPDSIAPPQQQQQQQQPVDCFPLSLVDVVIPAFLDPVPYEQWGRRVPELASSKSTTVAIPEIMTSRSWLFGSPKAASYQSPGSDKFVSSGACRAVGVACEKIDVDSPASLVLLAGDDDVVAGTAGESIFGADIAGESSFGSGDRSRQQRSFVGSAFWIARLVVF